MRYEAGEAEASDRLEELLGVALSAVVAQEGLEGAWIGCAPDDPLAWVLVSVWRDAGAMRRGIGAYEVKLALGPLQEWACEGSGVFEVRVSGSGGRSVARTSDRAADADSAGPGSGYP